MISLLIVDDHQVMLDGLESIFDGNDDFNVVGTATDATKGLDLIREKKPEVVLMDISMPGMDGITAMGIAKKSFPEIKVVILSMNNDAESITKAADAGADGYILKNAGMVEIQNAVSSVAEGMTYFSREVSQALIEGLKSERTAANTAHREELAEKERMSGADELLSLLSKKERVILRMLCDDRKIAEIADELGRSEFTVITHKKNIFKKLEVNSLAGLIKLCYDIGLLDLLNSRQES